MNIEGKLFEKRNRVIRSEGDKGGKKEGESDENMCVKISKRRPLSKISIC